MSNIANAAGWLRRALVREGSAVSAQDSVSLSEQSDVKSKPKK